MFRKQSYLSPLSSRKQLLVAESELNRAQAMAEWQTITQVGMEGVRRAKTIATWASSAALLVAGVTTLRRASPKTGIANSSWFENILNGGRLASTVWSAFRARGEKNEPK